MNPVVGLVCAASRPGLVPSQMKADRRVSPTLMVTFRDAAGNFTNPQAPRIVCLPEVNTRLLYRMMVRSSVFVWLLGGLTC